MWIFTSTALIFTVFALSNGQHSNEQRISMTASPTNETVYPGTNIVFTCRIYTPPDITETTLVNFQKVVYNPLDPQNSQKEIISTLTTLMNPYKNLGRFTITKTAEQSYLVYTLTISGAHVDDGGSYVCIVPEHSDSRMYATSRLQVYRPPSSVSYPNYNGSTVVEVTEGVVPTHLECLVAHVMPHPDVTLRVGTRDISQDSLVSDTVSAGCSNVGAISKACPLYTDYMVTAVPREYRPIYTDDGQDLICTSTMRTFNRTVNSTSIRLSVRYAPKITCTPLPVRVNSTNVVLRCKVYANPLIPYNITWSITIGGKNITLTKDDTNNDFKAAEMMDKSASPKWADVTLTINRVTESTFKYQFYLQAENELGVLSVPVQLRQDLTATPGGTGSRVTSISVWATLLLVTSSFLIYFRHC